jgi:hypothetical protein
MVEATQYRQTLAAQMARLPSPSTLDPIFTGDTYEPYFVLPDPHCCGASYHSWLRRKESSFCFDKEQQSQTITVPAGAEFSVTLQTVGPGEYNPPTVSSGVVHFLGVSLVGPYVPAGPTQQFRFNATTLGNAIIVFRYTATGVNEPEMLPVEDTVRVL